jgi:hypothetical protein
MLILGFLGFLQMTCIPGYLCLKVARWSPRSTIQLWVYSFATSLIVNFCLVYILTTLEFYNSASVYGVIILEICGALWLLKKRGFLLRSRLDLSAGSRLWVESFRLKHLAGCFAFCLAIACLLSYGHLFYTSIGSVFTLWDDTINWDRMAEQWAANRFPVPAGYYPQLIPTNWSLTYVILRTTDVKMFAKALMPLFSIATFLLFLDIAFRRKAPHHLIAAAIYGSLLYVYLGDVLIVSGYMETALAFFGFLTVYALLELSENGPTISSVLLASLFAAATGLVKQGGLYMVLLCAVWTGVVLHQRRADLTGDGQRRRALQASALGLLVLLPWYIHQYLRIAAGHDASNVSYLLQLTAQGKGPMAVVAAAFARLYGGEVGFTRPLCWFLAGSILLSVADPVARKVLLWVLGPILLLWALFFSYEVRTASLAFPFMAFCGAAGVGVLLQPGGLLSRRPVDRTSASSSRMFLLGAALVLAVSLSLYFAGIRDRVSFGWQPAMMARLAYWWALPLGGSALILFVVGLTAKRNWAMTINWWFVIGFGGWLWLATTMDRGPDIVARQIELQKDISAPELNRKLYNFMATEGLHGKVATDYLVFARLPILKQHYQFQPFPQNTSVADLTAVPKNDSGVCYILIVETELAESTREALAKGLYRTVFIEGQRRFIQTCGGLHGPD